MTKIISVAAVCIAGITAFTGCCSAGEKTKAYAKISVYDENKEPLLGTKVRLSLPLPNELTGKDEYHRKTATFSGKPISVKSKSIGYVTILAEKKGYYFYREHHWFSDVNEAQTRYLPWGEEIDVVLDKKTNPRPLYAHDAIWTYVPEFNAPCGYDLEKADWVAPYGNGVHSDFIFTMNRSFGEGEIFSGSMKINFSNPKDGIIFVEGNDHSKLLLGHSAPETGYSNSYERTIGTIMCERKLVPNESASPEDLKKVEGAWFRIRTEVDEKTGEIIKARYGKIQGYIRFGVRPKKMKQAGVGFVYYLAPDYSRSVEYNGESLVKNANLQCVTKH